MSHRLAPCPKSPNCVSSLSADSSHRMRPLGFTASKEDAMRAVCEALEALGGHVAVREGDYARFEFTSTPFRFVDDVEIVMDSRAKRIDFRSASRSGFWDLGVNRRRMDAFVRRLKRRDIFFLLSGCGE